MDHEVYRCGCGSTGLVGVSSQSWPTWHATDEEKSDFGIFNPLLRVCLNKQVSLLREWMVGIVGIRLFPENRHLAYFQGVYMKLWFKDFLFGEMIQYDSYFSHELKPPSINFWLSTFIAVISLYSPWTVSSFTRYVRRSWWRPCRDPATLQHDALRPTFRFRHAVRMSSRRVSILGRESGSGGKVCLEESCNHSNIIAGYMFFPEVYWGYPSSICAYYLLYRSWYDAEHEFRIPYQPLMNIFEAGVSMYTKSHVCFTTKIGTRMVDECKGSKLHSQRMPDMTN